MWGWGRAILGAKVGLKAKDDLEEKGNIQARKAHAGVDTAHLILLISLITLRFNDLKNESKTF